MTHHDFQHDVSVRAAKLLEQLLAVADSSARDRCPAACYQLGPSESGAVAGGVVEDPRGDAEFPGPALTIGLPWLTSECSLRWCGLRFFWWPRGVPKLRRCVILSSRLDRPWAEQKSWFADLRSSIAELNTSRDCVIVDSSVQVSRFVERTAELAQIKILRFCVTRQRSVRCVDTRFMTEWLSQKLRSLRNPELNSAADTSSNVWSVDVSPVLSGGLSKSKNASEIEFRPLADRLLFASAENIHVLHCREGGHTDALIHHHLLDPDRQNVPVLFRAGHTTSQSQKNQEPRNRRSRLIRATAGRDSSMEDSTGIVSSNSKSSLDDGNQMMPHGTAMVSASGNSCPLTDPDDWLLHWTRACDGPWPGQSEKDWLDKLITDSSSADHSAFATLKRIVEQERLIASSIGIRGKYQVVCFTEVPLTEFCIRKTFRRHRRRHDFEPWGVAVRRSALIVTGARPVIYGDDCLWGSLSQADRPWFQRTCSGADSKCPEKTSGWALEREWRIAGDLDLRQFGQPDVCWFVRDRESARQLSERTSRQVIVVPRTE